MISQGINLDTAERKKKMYDTHLALARSEFSHKPSYSIDWEHSTLESFLEYTSSESGKKYLPQFADLGGLCFEISESETMYLIRHYNPKWQTSSKDYYCYAVFEPGRRVKHFAMSEFEKALDYFVERVREYWG